MSFMEDMVPLKLKLVAYIELLEFICPTGTPSIRAESRAARAGILLECVSDACYRAGAARLHCACHLARNPARSTSCPLR